jgi:transcriptional regulator with XRE-family HTH domain
MTSVGPMLRQWRETRRLSQHDLAAAAEVSQRHVSHVETGKAHPSAQMVLVLSSALDVPLRERNALLLAAGYAPAYRETDLSAPELAQVRRALDFLMRQAEPYAAIVVDREWNVRQRNRPMELVTKWLLGDPIPPSADNIMASLFDPAGFRPYIASWSVLARGMLQVVHREAATTGDPRLHALLERLHAFPGVPRDWADLDLAAVPGVLVPFTLEKDGVRLDLFSTITTLGTPVDLTLQELRIETYFPADDTTESLVRGLLATLGAQATR